MRALNPSLRQARVNRRIGRIACLIACLLGWFVRLFVRSLAICLVRSLLGWLAGWLVRCLVGLMFVRQGRFSRTCCASEINEQLLRRVGVPAISFEEGICGEFSLGLRLFSCLTHGSCVGFCHCGFISNFCLRLFGEQVLLPFG